MAFEDKGLVRDSSFRSLASPSSPTVMSLPRRTLTSMTIGIVEPGWPAFWVVVLQDTIAWTFIMLMMTDLGATYFNNGTDPCVGESRISTNCNEVLGKLSRTSMIFGTASALLCTICGPITGCLADMFGTKRILVTSLTLRLGQFFAFVGLACGRMSIYVYFAAQEVASLVFSALAFNLWVIDNTPPELRVTTIARMQAVLSLEGAIVPIVVIWCPREFGPVIVMLLGLSSVAFAHWGMPTRVPSYQVTMAVRSKGIAAVTRAQLHDAWEFLTAGGNRIIIAVTILGQCATVGLGAIWYMFLKVRFGMDMHGVAKLSAISSSFYVVMQILVVPALQPVLGLKLMISIGMTFGLLSELLYIFLPSENWLVIGLFLSALGSMNGPAIMAMIANLATVGNENSANANMAAANSINAVSFLVGPLIFNGVFSHFLQPNNILFETAWPAAPYVLGMIFSTVALALLQLVPDSLFEKASAESTCYDDRMHSA